MTYIVETVKYKGNEITDSWNKLETQDLEAAKLMFESLKERKADGYGVLLSEAEYPSSFYSLSELLEEYRNGE